MDRVTRFNVIAMSGKAVEACGDVNTMILDKTGTITYGNRMADAFLPVQGVSVDTLARCAVLGSLQDDTSEGKSIVELGLRMGITTPDLVYAVFVPFTAQSRMSGVDLADGTHIRKGAFDAMESLVAAQNHAMLEDALGVVAIAVDTAPLDPFEKGLVMAVLGECALAMENEQIRESKDKAFMQARQESLRANLLRAISHDLRTPLTSISGNAHVLLANGATLPEATLQRLYADMYDDSAWLIGLVENILSVTRLEEGTVQLHMEPELLSDCVEEALRHVVRRSAEHRLRIRLEDELAMAYMDVRLIMQVIVNLVDNALKYTPAGSTITISSARRDDDIEVSVSDNGDGIPDNAKVQLFDMFFTAGEASADSRRGIGLFLCKSIVAAHGGRVWVEDNIPKGAVFTFTLRAAELDHDT